MQFYDIVSETCQFDDDFMKRLGFKDIFTINKEVMAVGARGIANNDSPTIALGKETGQLLNLVKQGATAVAITDSYIDRKLMEAIKEQGCILCFPMSVITSSYGVERTRNIYKMSKLFAHARKAKVDVTFVSMAKDKTHMNSCMQLIELAKLLGADEAYARKAIADTTRMIVEE